MKRMNGNGKEKKMKSSNAWSVRVVLAMVLTLAAVSTAQSGPCRGGKPGTGGGFNAPRGDGFGPHMGGRFGAHRMGMGREGGGLRDLADLTNQQESKIRGIRSTYADQMKGLRAKLRDARENVRVLLDSGDHEGAFEARSGIHKEMFVLKGKMMSEIRTILTDEQRKTLEERRAQRRERMKERREKRHCCQEE